MDTLLKNLLQKWNTVTFQVKEVNLIHRIKEKGAPFQTHFKIPLQGGEIQRLEPKPWFKDMKAVYPRNSFYLTVSTRGTYQLQPYIFDNASKVWVPATEARSSCVREMNKTLRIVNLNVLFDMYLQDQIYTKERLPFIHKVLENSAADVICLEVKVIPSL